MYLQHTRHVVSVQQITHTLCTQVHMHMAGEAWKGQGSRWEASEAEIHGFSKLLHSHHVGSGSYEAWWISAWTLKSDCGFQHFLYPDPAL